MSDYWEENLEDGQLADVSFPIEKRSISGGYDGARIRRPYRDGQEIDRTGRKPLEFELVIPLYRSVDVTHYPDVFNELLDVLTSDEPPIEYRDPVLGTFSVEVDDWQVNEDAERRSGAVVTIKLCEVTTADFSAIVAARSPGRAAIAWAAELDSSLAEAGVSDANVRDSFAATGVPVGPQETLRSGSVFRDMTQAFSSGLSVGASVAAEVERAVDTIRARTLGVMGVEQLASAAGWPARSAGFLMLEAVVEQGDRAVASSVPIVERVVSGALGARDLAASLYGDPARAAEIVRRNASRRPWAYADGTRVRVPVR